MINFLWEPIVQTIAELLWPIIKDLLKSSIIPHVEEFADLIKEQFNKGASQQTERAKAKAKDAEEKAKAATEPADVAMYKAVSEVWREVAEGLQKENQELKKDVEKIANVAVMEAELEKHKAVAAAWREAAESFKDENERLKKELDNIMISSAKSIKKSVDQLKMADVLDMSNEQKITLKEENPLLKPSQESTQH
jgi:hypothetical protein